VKAAGEVNGRIKIASTAAAPAQRTREETPDTREAVA
jgi:hypothetical protein